MDRTAAPAHIVRGLSRTVERIEAVAQRLSAAQLVAPPAPGAWSANELLWHIRATADVYGEHIHRILNEDEPRWRHVSPRARMKKTRYYELPFAESFAAFERQRADLVALLGTVAPEAWHRVALVKVAHRPGKDWRLSLHKRVWGMADHEEIHCAEMETAAEALSRTG